MSHKTHMSAMNAARKEFGKEWKASAKIEKVDGFYYVQVIQSTEPVALIQEASQSAIHPEGWKEVEGGNESTDPEPLIAIGEALAKADAEANAQALADASGEAADKGLWIHKSTTEKPTKKVWHIADAMVANAKEASEPVPTRKQVQEECVRQGIASGTARTQYQHWFKACADAAAAPIATIGKDGKVIFPGKA